MKIDLFQIGNFHVRGYGFMIGLGFLLALVLGCKRAKKLELKDESVIDIAILAIIGGFLGAKILYVIVSFKDFLKTQSEIFRYRTAVNKYCRYRLLSAFSADIKNGVQSISGLRQSKNPLLLKEAVSE